MHCAHFKLKGFSMVRDKCSLLEIKSFEFWHNKLRFWRLEKGNNNMNCRSKLNDL